MIIGPGGIDVLVEPGEWEPVAAVAARAARQLDLDPNTRWTLTDSAGRTFDQATTGSALFAGHPIELVDADQATTTAAPATPPERNLAAPAAVVAPAADPAAPPPLLVRRDTVQTEPVLRSGNARSDRFPPASVGAAVVAAVLAAVGGYAVGHRTDVAVVAPVVVTAPPRPVVLSGSDLPLGPIAGLSPERTAQPGQLVTAPTPATGTATGWRWQRCNDTGGDCQDIPGATDEMYPSPPTPNPLTIRVLVDTAIADATITWASAPFQALPEPPPTTTTSTTTTTTTVAPTPAETVPPPPQETAAPGAEETATPG